MTNYSWLPAELYPVAVRLARVDRLIYEIGEAVAQWSYNGPLDLEDVRRGEYVDLTVRSVRPVPPEVTVKISEVIGHLRSALDNAVWALLAREISSALTPKQEKAVALPICVSESDYAGWEQRVTRVGLAPLTRQHTLGDRIYKLQPFVDTTTVHSLAPALAQLMGLTPEMAPALRLLQRYSNDDKHRMIRLVVDHTATNDSRQCFSDRDKTFKPTEVGLVLATTRYGEPIEFGTTTAALLPRPAPWTAYVAPVEELGQLLRYVTCVAVPMMVLGMELTESFPTHVDLSDTGASAAELLASGSTEFADVRVSAMSLRMAATPRPVRVAHAADEL